MTEEFSIVQLHMNIKAKEIHSAIMLHEAEISECLKAGVDNAVSNISEKLTAYAANEAEKAATRIVEQYFAFGDGYKFLRDSIEKSLDEILGKMRKDRS